MKIIIKDQCNMLYITNNSDAPIYVGGINSFKNECIMVDINYTFSVKGSSFIITDFIITDFKEDTKYKISQDNLFNIKCIRIGAKIEKSEKSNVYEDLEREAGQNVGPINKKCICDIHDLTNVGCRCGGK